MDILADNKRQRINDRISYIPASENPLSSDLGIITGDRSVYIFDTGSTPQNLNFLHRLPSDKSIIVSHFHSDHTWWLRKHRVGDRDLPKDDTLSIEYERPAYGRLYVSKQSFAYTGGTDIVSEPVIIEDGVKLQILPLPCTHCKGSLALVVDDEYVFLGDSTYPAALPSGGYGYNAQLLNSEIEVLESLNAENYLLSHDRHFVRPGHAVLRMLKATYMKWDKCSPYIPV